MLWLTLFVSGSGEPVTGEPWPDSEEFSPSGKDGARRRQGSFLHDESVTGNPEVDNQLFSQSALMTVYQNGIKAWLILIKQELEATQMDSHEKLTEERCCFVTGVIFLRLAFSLLESVSDIIGWTCLDEASFILSQEKHLVFHSQKAFTAKTPHSFLISRNRKVLTDFLPSSASSHVCWKQLHLLQKVNK